MALSTDIIFHEALQADTSLMTAIGGKIYNTAIPLPDEDAENVPPPYIIITFDGLNNDAATKDDPYEGENDTVQIGIEITATTRGELATLAQQVRDIIHEDFTFVWRYEQLEDTNEDTLTDSNDFILHVMRDYDDIISSFPTAYAFSAGAVGYDADKPCYYQKLNYQCETPILYGNN